MSCPEWSHGDEEGGGGKAEETSVWVGVRRRSEMSDGRAMGGGGLRGNGRLR